MTGHVLREGNVVDGGHALPGGRDLEIEAGG
jgi:hypothetical protein